MPMSLFFVAWRTVPQLGLRPDRLRESGVTNMFGAGVYIQAEFGVEKQKASKLLKVWMETFAERHPR